jgi:zinc protease
MRPLPRLLLVATLTIPATAARAAPGAPEAKGGTKADATKPTAAPTPALKLDVRRTKLPNGLRVVLSVDPTSPTIAVDVMYDVGARNEERGHSGFAHLFEHMMFQGSANVPRGDHFQLVVGHGGTLNANTSSDRTNYFEMLPQSELPLALWLEADRMKSLDISQKNFENQRAVVKEEYRMRIENAAYVPAELRLSEMVFQGYWPYEHAAIGSMADLDAAQLDWVRAFHGAYYAPNDAALAISGDFDPDEAMKLVTRYFGDAKAQPEIPKYAPGPLPEQTAFREAMVEDAHAKLPAILEAWSIPPSREPDHYALEMAGLLLSDGESSRLHQSLVRDKGLAIEVDAGTANHRGPDVFEISVKLSGKAAVPQIQKLLDAQIDALARTGPTDAEMTKLQNRISSHFLFGLQSNQARAAQLAAFELYWGDASLVNTELARYLAVTREDIKRVAARYLTPSRVNRIEIRPALSADAIPAGPARKAGAK